MPEKSSELVSVTQTILQKTLQELTVAAKPLPEPKKRGRPKKVVVETQQDEDEEITCPKCGTDDPGDWSQCKGSCPMPESPHFKQKANNSPFPINLPPDPWGTWKKFNVSESSKVFVTWFEDCKQKVESGWGLKYKNVSRYLYLYIQKDGEKRPFAYVRKNTGDIHTPATDKHPF